MPAGELTTPGKRWRRRRNIAIAILHVGGMSQRVIADVFDLPRSRVSEILAEIRGETGETGRGKKALESTGFRGWYRSAILKTGRVSKRRVYRA